MCALAVFAPDAGAQQAQLAAATLDARAALPFAVGERLTYRVTVGRLGTVGHGTMTVEGPVDIRGTMTYALRSEVHARIGFLRASDRTESWLDPVRMAALRYRKRERRALSGGDEQVELFPDEQRWQDRDGRGGASPMAALDELSFIYFVRTLPLDADSIEAIVRHYDAARNPIRVRVLGTDTLTTPAGTFTTRVVELRVKDPQRYGGEGVIRLYLSDDAQRIPVRIESTVPVLGTTVLTLDTATPAPARLAHVVP
jgi:uncharacterized protein DUF3108